MKEIIEKLSHKQIPPKQQNLNKKIFNLYVNWVKGISSDLLLSKVLLHPFMYNFTIL